jgi:hypothetical protein
MSLVLLNSHSINSLYDFSILRENFFLHNLVKHLRSHGVMVSTLDFESSDPSSSLGGTFFRKKFLHQIQIFINKNLNE